jgi:protoporphyrinogen oxidase
MANIIIIGAGLTGLSAAYHLEKRGFFNYTLFEKESSVGGLCRSVQQDGFTFDYTGHLLHTSDDYFRSFIETVVGFENLNTIVRRSFVYSQNTFTRYPFQMNLFGLPEQTIIECIEGYVTRDKNNKKPKDFIAWVLANYGAGMGKHFFFPFQSKLFACDLHKISPSWVGRFVPQTSLMQIIQGATRDTVSPDVGYNANFFYPKDGGIEFWIKKVADQILKPIQTDHEVTRIDSRAKKVYFKNGHVQAYDLLINTMPLDVLLAKIDEQPHTTLSSARTKLECASVMNFNYGIAREDLTDKHWMYVPEKKYPFYRLGFPHNFARSAAPAGTSSLYGEFSYNRSSASTLKTRLATSKKAIMKIFNLQKSEIITEKIIPISHGYVLYTHWRERNLPKLLSALEDQNIFSVGRYGAWKYSSMQEAILDGKQIAETLTQLPAHNEQLVAVYSTPPKMRELQ